MDLELLAEPFHVSQIHWRVGSTTKDKTSGMALAYVDSRDVMDRLDKVCGAENWQVEHPWSDGKKLNCRIGININGSWVWKSDGAGDTAYEGDKGAFSDALKRAAVSWGIGRYLYRSPNWWAQIVPKGTSYAFTDASITELKGKYDNWLLPGKKEKFWDAYGRNRMDFDALLEALDKQDLDAAAEYWNRIPEIDQSRLWLAKSHGGMLDQNSKTIIHSTPFAVATAKAKNPSKLAA